MDTLKYKELTIEIEQDTDAESPREWDNVGTMVCFHRDYTLGDKHSYSSGDELIEFLETEKPPVVLPLFLLDHSGLAMRTGRFAEDSAGWDTSNVGVIYVTNEKIKKEFGKVTKETIETARRCLEGEVKTYSQYLEGDVYGYTINDQNGEHLDSCWGFFGFDDCKQEALSQAEYYYKEILKKHTDKLKAQIKNKVPLAKRLTLGGR
jgi:hypothetical protein